MLILTRRIGEKIIIGDNIVLTISGIMGNQVKFGIDAPKDVPIYRQEIYDRMMAENGVVTSHALLEKPKDIEEVLGDNIGNRIDYKKSKKTIEIINKKNPLRVIGKP